MDEMWTDQPIKGAQSDRLNFSHYADVLAEVVRTADTPITIGVFGPWGSGKTSLMRLIAEQLVDRRTEDHRWARAVWFNAWQYAQDEGSLQRVLLLRVLDGLESDQISEKDAQQITDWRTRLYTDVERAEMGSINIDWPKLGKGALNLGLSLIPTPSTFLQLAQLLQGEMGSLEEIASAFQRERIEVYRRRLTLLEEFRSGFAHLVQEYVWSRNGLLVVFIDDLDRCLPGRAVEVLEAIKLFLDVPGCVFFISVDRDIIERVVRVQYAGYLVGEDEDARGVPIAGQSYLEKIVQLPFHLPPLEDDQIAAFIDQHDPHLSPDCRDVLTLGLEPNPRVVKRALNILRLLLKLAERRAAEDTIGPIAPGLLAKMVVVQTRYRDLYRDLLEYPNLIQDLEWAAREGIEVRRAVSPLTGAETGPTGVTGATTLLERYLRHKSLLRMLRVGPAFADLTRDQINAYIYLTRTTSEDAGKVPDVEAARMWRDMLSNDPTRLRASVAAVQVEGLADEYAQALAQLLEPESEVSLKERLAAGAALAYLDDPRDLDEMMDVPGGEFQRGEEGESTYAMAYRIGRYPVTNGQYARFLAKNPQYPVPYLDEIWAEPYNWDPRQRLYPEDKANHPVVLVSWEDALAYCEWAGARLPTEEEWEKAARGKDGRIYPWGDDLDPQRANVRESGVGSTTPVGVYPNGASPYGLLDCAGNVWEWTTSQEGENQFLVRGGSWNFYARDARCFVSEISHPGNRSNRIGFRVVTGPQAREGVGGRE
ncbi:MAG: SUMF1/EgtB/PvdO family nonheme iron enzyme [Chloroflexota bacterium]|nr:SUMF1/EgtB/PvdO family nonheme iron enzyme [Chloroflexota bacterium]